MRSVQHSAFWDRMKRNRWKSMVPGEPYTRNLCPPPGGRGLRDWPDTGSNRTATVLSRCQNLQDKEQMV
jgi:hypothetical protein